MVCDKLDCLGISDCNGVSVRCDVFLEGGNFRCLNCFYFYIGDGCEFICMFGILVRYSDENWEC